jgi:hypothetical protein
MDPMDLIERFIAQVSRGLPRKDRLDIETEILTASDDLLVGCTGRQIGPSIWRCR